MPEPEKIVTACMLVIGNEILSGRTRDANLAWIAPQLNEMGIRLMEARFIPDIDEVIVASVNEVRARHDYVFTSGGIGPTHDDITADSIARAFGVGIDIDPRARAILEAHYQPGELTEARLRMARIPFGAELIDNPVSRAPGFRIANVFVMAGVPAILQAMFGSIRHLLVGGPRLLSHTVSGHVAEGKIADALRAIQDRHDGRLEVGSYPFYRGGKPGTSIVLRSTEPARLAGAAAEVIAAMRTLGVEPFEVKSG